jgi:hypothetical protein
MFDHALDTSGALSLSVTVLKSCRDGSMLQCTRHVWCSTGCTMSDDRWIFPLSIVGPTMCLMWPQCYTKYIWFAQSNLVQFATSLCAMSGDTFGVPLDTTGVTKSEVHKIALCVLYPVKYLVCHRTGPLHLYIAHIFLMLTQFVWLTLAYVLGTCMT